MLAAVKLVGNEWDMGRTSFAAAASAWSARMSCGQLDPHDDHRRRWVSDWGIGGRAYVDRRVIKAASAPLEPQGGLVALFGTLAPDGAILKRSAATPALFEKTARAMVFSSLDDLGACIDDPKLDVTADDILILQNAGPRSAYGMPEGGSRRSPTGCRSRASRTWCASRTRACRGPPTAPSSSACGAGGGGRRTAGAGADGRQGAADVRERRVDWLVDEAELAKRRAAIKTSADARLRGDDKLFRETVMQARTAATSSSAAVGMVGTLDIFSTLAVQGGHASGVGRVLEVGGHETRGEACADQGRRPGSMQASGGTCHPDARRCDAAGRARLAAGRSVVDVARSYVGIAVRAGAAKSDISSPRALKAALLGAGRSRTRASVRAGLCLRG